MRTNTDNWLVSAFVRVCLRPILGIVELQEIFWRWLRNLVYCQMSWGWLASTGEDVVGCKPSRPVSLKGQRH